MKVTNFKEVNIETVHVFSTWHSVPDDYDDTLNVWREFIVDNYEYEEDRDDWHKDLRAHVEAAAKKEFPHVVWEKINIWYYKVYYHKEAHKIDI